MKITDVKRLGVINGHPTIELTYTTLLFTKTNRYFYDCGSWYNVETGDMSLGLGVKLSAYDIREKLSRSHLDY